MADAFNNFFFNVENNLTNNIPSVNKSPLQYLKVPSQDSFFLFPRTTVIIIIFNVFFSTGIVPDLFKSNNYRPISILSIFNKLLEKLMHKRMLEFLEKNCIIVSSLTSGFNTPRIMLF